MQGTVLSFNRLKGLGFITPEDLGADIFVHHSALPRDHRYLNPGDIVEYEVGVFKGRPIATKLKIIFDVALAAKASKAVQS